MRLKFVSASRMSSGENAYMAQLRENFNLTHDKLPTTGHTTNSLVPFFADDVCHGVFSELMSSSINVDNLACQLPGCRDLLGQIYCAVRALTENTIRDLEMILEML